MKSYAAVLNGPGQDWEITEMELDGPQPGEVLLRIEYAGLCHSDHHLRHTPFHMGPLIGGHEGAGVVEEVGEGVTDLQPGDHVVTSFLPVCGRCHWCQTGRSYLCDEGRNAQTGIMGDGGFRFHRRDTGEGIGAFCTLGTFSQWATVHSRSVVKIDNDLPLDVACLLSCGVPTGWGSAVRAANVRPGEVVAVYGVGGVGINAIQGARIAGARAIVAVDPTDHKLDLAAKLGATHRFTRHSDAIACLADITKGAMANKVIITVGVIDSQVISEAFWATGKGGTMVLTGLTDSRAGGGPQIQLDSMTLTLFAKRLVGALFGDCNPHIDIPLLIDLYRTGSLHLDELITARYSLEEINQGYSDLDAGKNVRGIVQLTH